MQTAKNQRKVLALNLRPETTKSVQQEPGMKKNGRRAQTASNIVRKRYNDILPKNMNDIKHLIQMEEMKEGMNNDFITWLYQLRRLSPSVSATDIKSRKFNTGGTMPFSFDMRETQQKPKKEVKDVSYKGNAGDVWHFVNCNRTAQSKSTAEFQAGLRNYKRLAGTIQHKARFSSIPYKKKAEVVDYPSYLPPMKSISKNKLEKLPFLQTKKEVVKGKLCETISAYEGPQAYSKFNDRFREKNANSARHLLSPNKKLSTVLWETGLREYKKTK